MDAASVAHLQAKYLTAIVAAMTHTKTLPVMCVLMAPEEGVGRHELFTISEVPLTDRIAVLQTILASLLTELDGSLHWERGTGEGGAQ
jgi:hypothetical protein